MRKKSQTQEKTVRRAVNRALINLVRELVTRFIKTLKDKERITELRQMAFRLEIISLTPDGVAIPNPKLLADNNEEATHDLEDTQRKSPSKVAYDEEYFHNDDIMSPSDGIREISPTDPSEDYADEDGHSTGELDEVVMDAEKLRTELEEARKYIQRLRHDNKNLHRENLFIQTKLEQTELKLQQAEEKLRNF
jgi:hypothetical protein